MSLPVLYSFRRCPYAIRARMALFNSAIEIDLHEVSLKNKPQAMLDLSSKGTVPVLLVDDNVIDESLDIMLWALANNDPDNWCSQYSETEKKYAMQLIRQNDTEFKEWLDKYKYADRHPEFSQAYYRQNCEKYLQVLEAALHSNSYLMGEKITLADIAIFPFIRQFSMVDKNWFDHCHYPTLRQWLSKLLGTGLFIRVMAKTSVTEIQ
ncbi:MAG: glutathione S-transferase [Pseudohongiellaceae bacterium]|jgi:glutathione S-transferase|tara:strand:- start:369 stop:992 length:624 start_codon:yes stop_codon:yes gene_type:complete